MQRIKSFNERISAALKSPGKFFKKSPTVKAAPPAPPPKPLPKGYRIVERYPLYEPFAHAAIAKNPVTGEFKYILDELRLDIL